MGNDERFAALINEQCRTGDTEADHGRRDDLVIAALDAAGMHETAKAARDVESAQHGFWYA